MPRQHLVLVAPPWYPVPPQGYGGIEVVVHVLARELRARGWRVTVIGAEGSADSTILAPAAWRADLGGVNERLRELTYAARVMDRLRGLGPVDVVHDHVGFASLMVLGITSEHPVVHTVHGLIGEPEATFLEEIDDRVSLVAVSAHQRSQSSSLRWARTVHNAVDTTQLIVAGREDKEPYLLCLARICRDKGQHLAIEAAQRLELPLVLAGKVDSSRSARTYYENEVLPHIDGQRVRHIGNASGVEKALLLARARALVAPIQWDEPFGLSVVEAMTSGTPAVSMARGAAPELIDEGVTGFLVEDVDAMVAALRQVESIDPQRCATVARERFGPAAMADGYLNVYRQVPGAGVKGNGALTGWEGPSTAALHAQL